MIRRNALFALIIAASLSAFAQKPNLPNDTTAAGDVIFTEIATPGTNPVTGKSRFYIDSTLHLPCSMSATGTVTCMPASQSVTLNTTSPITGGGSVSLGGSLTFACATCNTTNATVSSFSAGTLSPLFTTSVATATTTPALSFSLSNAAANTIFSNFSNSSGAPAYNAISACGDSTHALSYVAGTGFGCQALSSSGVTGSGTTGKIPKWSSSTALTDSTATDIVAEFTGCSGTQYLGADGACHTASGAGTVTSIATTSPITGGTITTTGTIACATCAIGPGSSTANHLAKFSGTDGVTLADGGAIPTGTVTSVTCNGGLTGGAITTSGTCALATSNTGSTGSILLEEHTASSAATLDFTTAFTSTNDDYECRIIDAVPTSAAQDFKLLVSTNGGSSYDTSNNYFYGTTYVPNSGGGGVLQGSSVAAITIFTAIDNTAANGGISGTLHIYNPLSGSIRKAFNWQVNASQASAAYNGTGFGIWGLTTAVNAIRFQFGTGAASSFASGTIRCYGLTK